MSRMLATCLAIAGFATLIADAHASDVHEATLTIQDHRFVPAEMKVPAGRKIKLTVINKDATAEEFESYELNREKIVAGNGRIIVYVGPLRPGRYPYFGEFHMDTAQGVLVAE